MAAKRDIYLRLLQHERSPWRVFVCIFSQSVWTALNKHERLKPSTTTIYPPGLTRKSLKYVCWRTSNNCRVNTVIYHHPFYFLPPFPLDGLRSFAHMYFICSLIQLNSGLIQNNKSKWGLGFFLLRWLFFAGTVCLEIREAWGKGAFEACLLGCLIKGWQFLIASHHTAVAS